MTRRATTTSSLLSGPWKLYTCSDTHSSGNPHWINSSRSWFWNRKIPWWKFWFCIQDHYIYEDIIKKGPAINLEVTLQWKILPRESISQELRTFRNCKGYLPSLQIHVKQLKVQLLQFGRPTFASQVTRSVGKESPLLSQKHTSAPSPPWRASSHAWKALRRQRWSEHLVPANDFWRYVSRRWPTSVT